MQQQQQIPQQKPLQLTQESFNQFDEKKLINASFDDDLPPPPPPLSSSPTLAHQNRNLNLPQEDTDNNSSITTDTTAQVKNCHKKKEICSKYKKKPIVDTKM